MSLLSFSPSLSSSLPKIKYWCYSGGAFNKVLKQDSSAAGQFIIPLSTTSLSMGTIVIRTHGFCNNHIILPLPLYIHVGGLDMFQNSCLVPPLTGNSDSLLQLTGKASGALLFLKTYCLPLSVLY